ncbi:MAG: hypothetical protein K2P68_03245 [Sphingomonas sp.]|nr:hypothetical protein [Sphingomonas sp.]
MSRVILFVVVIVAVVIGGALALSARSGEKPLTHVEKAISLGDLKK